MRRSVRRLAAAVVAVGKGNAHAGRSAAVATGRIFRGDGGMDAPRQSSAAVREAAGVAAGFRCGVAASVMESRAARQSGQFLLARSPLCHVHGNAWVTAREGPGGISGALYQTFLNEMPSASVVLLIGSEPMATELQIWTLS